MSVTTLRTGRNQGAEEWALRVDLAAAFRLAALQNWHESVANHFSVAVDEAGRQFLMNPRWKHFSRIKASDLLLLDAAESGTMERADAPDPSAWAIHGAIHAANPKARCVLHVHSAYATALSCLADPALPPLDQNAARFFNRVSIDRHYGGIADNEAEGRRLAACLGGHQVLVLANHGVLVAGASVAEAYDVLYYFERSCQTYLIAAASGRPINVLPDDVAERTARAWVEYPSYAEAHFSEMKKILDERGENYAN